MTYVAGIDYSTLAIDVVLIDENGDNAEWHRQTLEGHDAFERCRYVRRAMLHLAPLWENSIAIGIEDPRGYNAGALYRIQGAILARLPRETLVQPFPPGVWRNRAGLAGNASKGDVAAEVRRLVDPELKWPQDACDAYLIALATKSLMVTS